MSVTELLTPSLIKAALDRQLEYRSRVLSRTHWCENPLMAEQYEARTDWFNARERYLNDLLTVAVKRESPAAFTPTGCEGQLPSRQHTRR